MEEHYTEIEEFENYLEKKETEKNLFTLIWTSPRKVFRFIDTYRYSRHVTLLLVLGGIVRGFDRASQRNMGDTHSIEAIIGISVFGGALFGWISYYIYAALLSFSGKWLKGKGSTKSLVRMLAYASVPAIAGLILLIPQIAVYGNEVFKADGDTYSGGIVSNILFYGSLVGQIALWLWSLVLIVIGLSEVQKFSIGKAILNLLLPVLFIGVPLVLLFWFTASFS